MNSTDLMKTGWQPRLPAFKEHLPGCIGYVGVDGSTIYYGRDYAIRAGLFKEESTKEFLARIEPEIERAVMAPSVASFILVKPIPKTKTTSKKSHVCSACSRNSGLIDRHHVHPVQVGGRGTRTIRLCRYCHELIHYLPNEIIVTMNRDAQLTFIRLLRPILEGKPKARKKELSPDRA